MANLTRPARFDPDIAHPARVYAYWLGRKITTRPIAKRLKRSPHTVRRWWQARANRAFLPSSVRYLAGRCGIGQFLDIGPGLPAPLATHEVAQAIAPEARVVYVDNDPLVLSHARALLASSPEGGCDYIDADLRDPDVIVREAACTLDFARPAAVLLLAVLHFIPDSDNPAGIVARLAAGLAPGSFIVISHLTADCSAGSAPGPVSLCGRAVAAIGYPPRHAHAASSFWRTIP